MIDKIIDSCVRNRVLVLLMTAVIGLGGLWAAANIRIDAIPDLSDVQVVIRTEYTGQAPQIVEDQVTYPLTTAMLAVPYAKVVRGYSMFGTSFVYIIFEDGTDLYWARSRVLEQLNFVSAKLPAGVSPQLGPDATGVGWIYEYALVTGPYCPDHPNGLWQDPEDEKWYASPEDADEDARGRLVHHRVFEKASKVWVNQMTNQRFDSYEDIPPKFYDRVAEIELTKGYDACPLDGSPLAAPNVDLSDLRGIQDWYLRYELTAVDGVSEVASLGGFVKQYQVIVDPVKLLAYKLPIGKVRAAIARSNIDTGGRIIETSETEYMVRGLGYLGAMTAEEITAVGDAGGSVENFRSKRALEELRQVSLGASEDGSPIYLSNVAEVRLGPEIRRGIAEWSGQGEVVAGIVIMRFGENARTTIDRVRDKLEALQVGLPPGVGVVVGYDRSDLIDRAVETLTHTLMEEMLVVTLICILFLLHARSALVAVFVLPTGVLLSLIVMHLMGLNANIMSLGGIALAIGVMVDSSIVMVENAHKHFELETERLARGEPPRSRVDVVAEAAKEVGPSLFFSLLIITVSFIPVFVLGEQSGRLFKPLAYTKTFAMASAAILAVTVIPVLMVYFITERVLPVAMTLRKRLMVIAGTIVGPAVLLALVPLPTFGAWRLWLVLGWLVISTTIVLPQRILPEERNPLSRLLERIYDPAFRFAMRHQWGILIAAVLAVLLTLVPLSQLGSEFMPPLEEGDLLYMPTTDPGISVAKSGELLQQTDKLIMGFPEVQSVLGKAGRAETATDPAPPSMLESTITLNRDKSKWRTIPVERFYSGWPGWAQWLPSLVFDDTRPITVDELIYGYDSTDGSRIKGLNDAVQLPGITNSWTMPIKTRIDMLSTGIKTPVGIKVMGPDLETLAKLTNEIAQVVKTSEGTGAYTTSAFPEKSVGGNYLNIHIDREAIARYGLTIADVQDVIMTALGGMNVSYTIEGLERYPVNLRYPSELRDNLPALQQTLVSTPSGAQVPLGQLTTMTLDKGPPMIKSENSRRTAWVYVDISNIDVGTYVHNAQRAVDAAVKLPPGYSIVWSGQFEYMEAARERLTVVIPLVGVLIILLLYFATHSWLRVSIVLLAVPFSLVGAVWLLYFLDYNLSLAVGVGLIALAGLDAETGLVMLLYLENSFDRFTKEGRMRSEDDLFHAVHDGAVKRIRPKTMTVMTTFIGLVPLLWAAGAGADTMRRLAAPLIGGLATSFLMELLIYPVIFYVIKRHGLRKAAKAEAAEAEQAAVAG